MSVLIETSLGDIVVDLYYKQCPKAYQNFISLCRIKYYNNCLFFNIQKNFIAQTGDPTNTGQGGHSIFHLLSSKSKSSKLGTKEVYFEDEIHLSMKHNRKGLLCMANQGRPNTNSSQFFFTTTDRHLDYLDQKHTIFGEVAEGMDVLEAINNAYTDKDGKPYQVIRIKHTYVVYDAVEEEEDQSSLIDLSQLRRLIPPQSPELTHHSVYEQMGYLIPEEGTETTQAKKESKEERTKEEIDEEIKQREGKSRALVLEMIGDLPSAEMKPPENVLFVCKLNPTTTDSDLAVIFSRFGEVLSCEIIKDHKTGESLCYGFVEMSDVEACERAFVKMQNVVVDDRRIHVDFSQSVAKLWNKHYTTGHKKKKSHDHRPSRDYRDSSSRGSHAPSHYSHPDRHHNRSQDNRRDYSHRNEDRYRDESNRRSYHREDRSREHDSDYRRRDYDRHETSRSRDYDSKKRPRSEYDDRQEGGYRDSKRHYPSYDRHRRHPSEDKQQSIDRDNRSYNHRKHERDQHR